MSHEEGLKQELNHLVNLLAIEKKEDQALFESKNEKTSYRYKRKAGICWYPVILEKNQYDLGERLIVRVSRSKEHIQNDFFQSGKPVKLFCVNKSTGEEIHDVKGVVNQSREQEMHLTLSCDSLPIWVHDGLLGVQLLFDEHSYKEMEYALSKVQDFQDNRLQDLLAVLYGKEAPKFELPKSSLPYSQLNDSQLSAQTLCLTANDVALVHGPPGTGKTTTLIATILNLLRHEAQLLVCAPSNAAVDLLVERLLGEGVSALRIGHPARVTEEVLSSTIDAKIAQHRDFKLIKDLRKKAEEYFAMGGKWKRNFGRSEREQRHLLLSEARKMKLEADQLYSTLSDHLLSSTQVIASTLVGASNIRLRGMKFEYVIIDEAGQALEPACWIPILKANRVIFAGDHLQLPPTVKSMKASKEGLSETLFEKVMKRQPQAAALLQLQYRMHANIMDFPNQALYHGKLKAHASVASQLLFPEDQPLVFIDTAGTGYLEEIDPDSKSSCNPENAKLLLTHLKKYLETLAENSCEIPPIGIITPYRSQVEYLSRLMEEEKKEGFHPPVKTSTVDSFQGQERSIIYIDLVRSNERGDIGFLSDIRRMNVAMTRAKQKLVVIGDSATIGTNPFYEQFITYCQANNSYQSAFEWISF